MGQDRIQRCLQFDPVLAMEQQLNTISPTTNEPVLSRNVLSAADTAQLSSTSDKVFKTYRHSSLQERQRIVSKALDLLDGKKDELAEELTEHMGRPIAYPAKEISTAVTRGRYLLKISEESLKDTEGEAETGFKRYIRKEPLGPILIIFAWNVSLVISSKQMRSQAALIDA